MCISRDAAIIADLENHKELANVFLLKYFLDATIDFASAAESGCSASRHVFLEAIEEVSKECNMVFILRVKSMSKMRR